MNEIALLLWGTIDTYNSVKFFNTLTGQVGPTYTGSDVPGITAGANQTSYVNFFSANATEYFNQIQLSSASTPAFESDNHAFRAVPTPALLPGLVGIGVSLWRKRRQQAA
jgi:hypothetical protein